MTKNLLQNSPPQLLHYNCFCTLLRMYRCNCCITEAPGSQADSVVVVKKKAGDRLRERFDLQPVRGLFRGGAWLEEAASLRSYLQCSGLVSVRLFAARIFVSVAS